MPAIAAMQEIKDSVLKKDLCTGCGACVNLCPYYTSFRDATLISHDCDRLEGACRTVCPRTRTDLQALERALFEPPDLTPEAGAIKDFLITRAADGSIRDKAQHGGTVSTLVSLALETGLIDTAVLAEEQEFLLPSGVAVQDPGGVTERAKSSFVVSPTLARLNSLAGEQTGNLAIVATPCQALALAKMKTSDIPRVRNLADRVKLVIGLFCGWAFDWRKLKAIVEDKTGRAGIIKLDIPPSRFHALVIQTDKGEVEVSLDEVKGAVRPSCNYCFDMTAEFSDISVGSARLPEGWTEAKSWNQVIVRTETGRKLMAEAQRAGALEFRPVPEGNLERLKKAAANKKKQAVAALEALSGRSGDLVYLTAAPMAPAQEEPRGD